MDTTETPVTTPKLPPELERMVFEMAARTYPAGILPLMLVAWRVKYWVEPFLYRVIHLSPHPGRQHYGFPLMPLESLLKIVLNQEDPKSRSFCEAVEYVFLEEILIDPISPILDAILRACPKITDFFTRRPIGSNLEALASLRCLRRLAIDTYNLFSNSSPITPIAPAAANFAHPLFRNLTHLELTDLPARHGSGSLHRSAFYAQLILIPELTHISFNSAALAIGIHPTLAKIKTLRCIVILGLPLRPHESELNSSSLIPDDRFVYIRQTDFQRDWFDCAKGGGGYWGIAEVFLAARRKGDVDRATYLISDKDSRWRE
ncbi:hypothetical protein R3P38DRAFT_2914801, partial [Favolaschia claudopus]